MNLTLAIDDAVVRKARMRALENDTSVNALVRKYLADYADDQGPADAMRRFLALGEEIEAGSAGDGRSWTREDLYAERTAWPR